MSQGDDRKTKDAPRWAADEPTAMWDGSSIDVANAPKSTEKAATEPAPAPPAAPRSGLSWPLTIAVAVAVAVAVYFVVRALRG